MRLDYAGVHGLHNMSPSREALRVTQNQEKTWCWTSRTCIWFVFCSLWCFFLTLILNRTFGQNGGSQYSLCFWKFVICHVFKTDCFLEGPEVTFFDFGRFWGPPKSTLTLQKAWFYLSESSMFKKSCFFIKKQGSKKTWFFINFGGLQITQNHLKSGLASGLDRSFFRYEIPSPSETSRGPPWGPLLDAFLMNLRCF